MDTLYEDFTNALRSSLTSLFHCNPLDQWNPQETAAPERHKALSEGSWDDDAQEVDHQNSAFGLVESMVRVFFVPSEVEDRMDDAASKEKEQVWLFAHHWLSIYYDFLMDTRAVHTTFYKQYHERFLQVLRGCLCVSANKRYTFRELAMEWKPSLLPTDLPLSPPPHLSPSTTEPTTAVTTIAVSAPVSAPVSATASAPVSATASAPASAPVSDSVRPKRLVLLGPRGHNRTRRNLHS